MESIPFVDLKSQYQSIKDEVLSEMMQVIESNAFIKGPWVENFSRQFCEIQNLSFGVGCSNGTSALTLALKALGVQRGDEVITSTHTFIATAESISEVGAIPVFVDINESDYQMNVDQLEKVMTSKTKAIIPVHLYGTPCDMGSITKFAKKNNLKIVEDCAQAHLGSFNEKKVGTWGDACTFSFYPGKNLGAYGDAGFIGTNDEKLYERMKALVDHGRKDKYVHDILGGNYRMDGIQGAVLSVKLKRLKEWTKKRQENAKLYNSLLTSEGFKVVENSPKQESVYHLYIVEVSNRQEVQKHLKEKGISSGVHYPIPLHLQPAYDFLDYKEGDFPVAEKICARIVSLPMFPELTEDQIKFIVKEFLHVARK